MEEEEREQDVFDLGKGRPDGESGQLWENLFPLKPLSMKSNSTLNCLKHTSSLLSRYFSPNLHISLPSLRTDSSSQLYSVYVQACSVAQSCLTLWSHDCSPPGCSVHGIFQAKILEWVVISFSRGSSWPRDQTRISCITGRFFTTEPPEKPLSFYRWY